MNDTDLDIILAIADDRLTGEAKTDALERIAADPELGEELAIQIAAMDELKLIEPALMTPAERATLRANLVEQLNLSPAAPAVIAKPGRRPWWQPVLGLASAAALIIAIVAVPSMFSGSDDTSADFVAIAPEATTSAESATEPDAESRATTSNAASDSDASSFLVPQISEGDVEEFFDGHPGVDDITEIPTSDDAAATGAEDETKDSESQADSPTIASISEADLFAIDAEHIDTCLATLADDLPEGEHTPLAVTLDDGTTVVHFGIDTGEGITYSVSIDLDSCVITSLTP